MKEKINKTKTEWQQQLTPEQFQICRLGGTEPPFTGKYCNLFKPGIYLCVCCKVPLFSSEKKFDSGSGWPDFIEAISDEIIKYIDDYSTGLKQIEVKCANCDAHLGHLFEDGPPPDFKRY